MNKIHITGELFDRWNAQKQVLDAHKNPPSFKTGEIWWCSIGKNIGREVYGKGSAFARPVYIFKKISRDQFLGIPLTSQEKNGTWFHKIQTHEHTRWAILPQIRILSANRLIEKIVILYTKEQNAIKESLLQYLRE